jgi:hypothetical protein
MLIIISLCVRFKGSRMSNKSYHIHQAALLMRSQHSGVLSTQSVSLHGYPFGSVMPCLMTEEGNLVV